MADVVDSIVAELVAKVDGYVANFDKASAAHGRFRKSLDQISAKSFDLAEEGRKYKGATGAIAGASEQADQRITRSRQRRSSEIRAIEEREVTSARRAAKEKADAEIAEAERSARLRAAVERGVGKSRVVPGSGAGIGATVPREGDGGRAAFERVRLPAAAQGEEEAARRINYLEADRFDLQQKVRAASGETKRELAEQLDYLRRINTYKRAGLDDDQAVLRAEREIAAIRKLRPEEGAAQPKKRQGGMGSANDLALALSGGTFGYSFSAGAVAGAAGVAGIAAVATITALTSKGLEYAKALRDQSDQLKVTTRDLQIWQTVANNAGVSTDQLQSAFGQLSENLGKAQLGSDSQQKIFKTLNIDIGNATDGYKTLSDILPSLVDRLSKISSATQRAAIETQLGGEQFRRLDPIISNGTDSFNEMAASIEATGQVLGDAEIQRAGETADKLKALGDQLQRRLASVVAENAGAINQLAETFFRLADGALKAISALQRFGMNKVLRSYVASDADKNQARETLLQTPEGRQTLRQLYSEQRAMLDRGDQGKGFNPVSVGLPDVPDNAKSRAALRAQVAANELRLNVLDQQGKEPTPASPQPGNPGDVSGLLAPKPRRGRRGKSADQLAREAAAREKRFTDEADRLEQDRLSALREQTSDEEARRDIDRELLDRQLERQIADYNLQVKEKQLTRDQADILIAKAKQASTERRNVIATESTASVIERGRRFAEDRLEAEADALNSQLYLARTAKERREIEKRLLDIAIERERIANQDVLDRAQNGDPSLTDADIKLAQRNLGRLDNKRVRGLTEIDRRNQGPLAQYRDSIPRTADQINEALENVEVRGLQRLEDQLTDTIASVFKLGGAFGSVASQIIADLVRIGIQRQIISPIADMLFGKQGGGGSGLFSSIFGSGASAAGTSASSGSFFSALGLPGFATGGGMPVGGLGGVDRNVVSVNGVPRFRASNDEVLAAINVRAANRSIRPAAGSAVTVIAPQQFDLSGVVMTEQLVGQLEQRNRAYANAVAAQAGRAAVNAAPGRMAQIQTLGN